MIRDEITETMKFSECLGCANFCTLTCNNCDTGEFYDPISDGDSADAEMSKGFRSDEIWSFISEADYE